MSAPISGSQGAQWNNPSSQASIDRIVNLVREIKDFVIAEVEQAPPEKINDIFQKIGQNVEALNKDPNVSQSTKNLFSDIFTEIKKFKGIADNFNQISDKLKAYHAKGDKATELEKQDANSLYTQYQKTKPALLSSANQISHLLDQVKLY